MNEIVKLITSQNFGDFLQGLDKMRQIFGAYFGPQTTNFNNEKVYPNEKQIIECIHSIVNPLPGFDRKEWDKRKFQLYIFFKMLFPDKNDLITLDEDTEYGPLFCLLKNNCKQINDKIFENFLGYLDKAIEESNNLPFRAVSIANYLYYFPNLLKIQDKSSDQTKIRGYLSAIFDRIKGIRLKESSDEFLHFLYELLRTIIPDPVKIINPFFQIMQEYPYFVLTKHSQFLKLLERIPEPESKNVYTMLGTMSRKYMNSLQYNQQNENFWDAFVSNHKNMNEKSKREFVLLILALIKSKSREQIRPNEEVRKEIIETLQTIVNTPDLFDVFQTALFLWLDGILMFPDLLVPVLSEFEGIGADLKGFVLFTNQLHETNRLSPLDAFLKTAFKPEIVSQEEYQQKSVQKYRIAESLHFESLILFTYLVYAYENLLKTARAIPIPFTNFMERLIRFATDLLIQVCAIHTVVSESTSFAPKKKEYKPKREMSANNFIPIMRRLFILIPTEHHTIVSSIMASELIVASENQMHSMLLILRMHLFIPAQIIQSIVEKMFIHVIARMTKATSMNSIKESEAFFQIAMFTLRLAEGPKIVRNDEFGKLLMRTESYIGIILRSLKGMPNHEHIFLAAMFINEARKFHGQNYTIDLSNQPPNKIQTHTIDEIRISARHAASNVYLSNPMKKDASNIGTVMPFVYEALQSNDPDSISFVRSFIDLKLLDQTCDFMNSRIRPAYNMFLKRINLLSGTQLDETMRSIVENGKYFIMPPEVQKNIKGPIVPEIGVSVSDLMLCIHSATEVIEDNAPHILAVSYFCIDIVKQNYEAKANECTESIYQIISAVSDLHRFQEMRPRVRQFFDIQNRYFAKIAVTCGPQIYFLVLNQITSSRVSSVETFLMKVMDDYMIQCAQYNPDIEIFNSLIEQLVNFHPNKFKADQESIVAYYIISKHFNIFATEKGFTNLRTLILQCFSSSFADSYTVKLVKSLFKMALGECGIPSVDHELFMTFAFENGDQLINLQYELLKAMASTGLHLNIENLDDIITYTPNPEKWSFKLAAAFLCGINRGIYITPNLKKKIFEYLKDIPSAKSIKEQRIITSKFILTYGLFKGQPVDVINRIFTDSERMDFEKTILFKNTQLFLQPIKRGIFKAYRARYPLDTLNQDQFINFARQCNSLQKRCNFNPLAQIILQEPLKISKEILQSAATCLEEFARRPETDQPGLTPNLSHIINVLKNEKFINREDVASYVRIEKRDIIPTIIKYYSHIEHFTKIPIVISGYATILSLAQHFPEEAMSVMDTNDEFSKGIPNLLYRIMLDDNTNIVVKAYLDKIERSESITGDYMYPYFELIARISTCERIVSLQEYRNTVISRFTVFYKTVMENDDPPSRYYGQFLQYFTTALLSVIRIHQVPQDALLVLRLNGAPMFESTFSLHYKVCVGCGKLYIKVLEHCIENFEAYYDSLFVDSLYTNSQSCDLITNEMADRYVATVNKYLSGKGARQACFLIGYLVPKVTDTSLLYEFYEVFPLMFEDQQLTNVAKISHIYNNLDEAGFVPDELYINIVAKIVSNSSAIDITFRMTLQKVIKSRRHLLTPLPPVLVEAINIFLLDKFATLPANILSGYVMFLFNFPEFINGLSYNPLLIFTKKLANLPLLAKQIQNQPFAEFKLFIQLSSQFLMQINVCNENEYIKEFISEFLAVFCRKCVTIGDRTPLDNIPFQKVFHLIYATKNKFPEELMMKLSDQFSTLRPQERKLIHHVVLIYGALCVNPDHIFTNIPNFDEEIRALINPQLFKMVECAPEFLGVMCRPPFNRGLAVYNLFKKYGEDKDIETRIKIGEQLIKAGNYPPSVIIRDLVNQIKSSDFEKGQLLFSRFCRNLPTYNDDIQLEYLDEIEKLITTPLFARLFIISLGTNLESDSISPVIKERLVHDGIYFGMTYQVDIKGQFVDVARKFGDSAYIQFMILHAHQSSSISRIKTVETCRKVLGGSNAVERFLNLNAILPPIFWCDLYLPIITLIVIDEFAGISPIIGIANKLEAVCEDMATSMFRQVVNDCPEVCSELLRSIIVSFPRDTKLPHTAVVASLTSVLSEHKGTASPQILRRAGNISDNFYGLSKYIEEGYLEEKIITPHYINDFVFAANYEKLKAENEKLPAAAAHLILGNYTQSLSLFNEVPELSETSQMFANVAQRFYTDSTENWRDSTRHVLGSDNSYTLAILGESGNLPTVQISKINKEMKQKRHISIFDMDRFIFVSHILQMNNTINVDLGNLDASVSPIFRTIISKYQGNGPELITPVNEDSQCCVFSTVTKPIFSQKGVIAGITEIGEYVVDVNHAESCAMLHQKNILSQSDFRAWASFSMTAFISNPSYRLLANAITAYVSLCKHICNGGALLEFEAASRLISLLLIEERMNQFNDTMRLKINAEIESFGMIKLEDKAIIGIWMQAAKYIKSINFQQAIDDVKKSNYGEMIAMESRRDSYGMFTPNGSDSAKSILPIIIAFSPFSQYIYNDFDRSMFNNPVNFDVDLLNKVKSALKLSTYAIANKSTIDFSELRNPNNCTEIAELFRKMELEGSSPEDFMQEVIDEDSPSQVVFDQFTDSKPMYRNYQQVVSKVNMNLPRMINASIQNSTDIFAFSRITGDILKFGNSFLLDYISYKADKYNTLIISATKDNSIVHSVNVLQTVLRLAMMNNHESITRGLIIDDSISYEIGKTFSGEQCLSFSVHPTQFRPLDNYFDLDDESPENIELARRFVMESARTPKELFDWRMRLMRSYAANCLPQILMPPQSRIPLIVSDRTAEFGFERSLLRVNGEIPSLKIPTALALALGPNSVHIAAMGIAAGLQAIRSNLEPVVAVLETIYLTSSPTIGIERMTELRDSALDRLAMLVPTIDTVIDGDRTTWLQKIEHLLRN